MKPVRALLPLLALGVSSLLVAAETSGELGWRGVDESAIKAVNDLMDKGLPALKKAVEGK